MKNILAAFITEIMKLKRSKIFLITILFFIFIPLMTGLLMYIAQNPEMASKLGLMGAKAQLFGTNNWEGYSNILKQMMASIGLIGFGFVTSWVFGREYIEHTLIDLLGSPIPRSSIVISKFIIIFLWCILLCIIFLITGITLGFAMDIPGWTAQFFNKFMNTYIKVSLLTIILCTPVGFIASYGKGIIAPLGFVILTLIMAQFVAMAGIGPYFPWAIPGVLTVPEGTDGFQLFYGSYIIIIATSILGLFGTIVWWKMADHH